MVLTLARHLLTTRLNLTSPSEGSSDRRYQNPIPAGNQPIPKKVQTFVNRKIRTRCHLNPMEKVQIWPSETAGGHLATDHPSLGFKERTIAMARWLDVRHTACS